MMLSSARAEGDAPLLGNVTSECRMAATVAAVRVVLERMTRLWPFRAG